MNLRAWRTNQSLTQAQTAELLGVTQGLVSSYETGTRFPRPNVVMKAKDISGGLISESDWYAPPPIAAEPQTSAAAQGGLTSGSPSGPSCAPPSHAPAISHDSHEQEHRP